LLLEAKQQKRKKKKEEIMKYFFRLLVRGVCATANSLENTNSVAVQTNLN
jgi:hypothetical protein